MKKVKVKQICGLLTVCQRRRGLSDDEETSLEK